jgi:hypothetical protein
MTASSATIRIGKWKTLAVGLLMGAALHANGEEIWLYDNTRLYGLVEDVTKDGKIQVFVPTTERVTVPLENIISIRFLGRDPLLVQAGTQEFRFVNGGNLRGRIAGYEGNEVVIESAMAGRIAFDLAHCRGFVALPMFGFSSLKAEELVEEQTAARADLFDMIIDRRGSQISGVLRQLHRTHIDIDIDDLLQVKPIKIPYLKGVRLANAARAPRTPWKGETKVILTGRDGSVVHADVTGIHLSDWQLKAGWHTSGPVAVPLQEISEVRVMGGKVQYLSQLEPVAVEEQTILAPPQPFAMDRSCQKHTISIAGKRYPWGIGVHADSSLTFEINKRFAEFRADVGVDTRMGNRGSVVFHVLGEGKELYKSPVVRGGEAATLHVAVGVAGVSRLTLRVTNGGDLDLGDVANWGSARLLKEQPKAPQTTAAAPATATSHSEGQS